VARKAADLRRSVRFWLVGMAASASLAILMYVPAAAELISVRPLSLSGWGIAFAAAGVAVGWRFLVGAGQRPVS